MDFLKDILGTELFEQVANAVNAYNGNEANKDKQIKIANLASGKYVDKNKYTDLEKLLNQKETDLTDAQKLIDDLKESAGKGEDMATKIAEFETTIRDQQEELKKAKTESALKIELLSAGAKADDIDYLLFKLGNDSDFKAELDENGKLKGIDDKLKNLKTIYPNQFEAEASKNFDENHLPGGKPDDTPEPATLTGAIRNRYENKE
ncbi:MULTISPECIES: phage scaffolding protein [Catenibacterium]|mgnify:CR=1 FL=1|uniref:Phage scaffolding protein n=1 Tax=Catenibacterium faecis TaxID=2764323 RepID=A0ABR7KBE1_9FIRM|nr:phage scaffolding protein [Catenibacterium faecis]MBC6010043.1 phage scaffolding protein [Catenibacterium faecis]